MAGPKKYSPHEKEKQDTKFQNSVFYSCLGTETVWEAWNRWNPNNKNYGLFLFLLEFNCFNPMILDFSPATVHGAKHPWLIKGSYTNELAVS